MKIDNKLVHKVAAIKKKATNSLASEAQTIQNKFSKKIPFTPSRIFVSGFNNVTGKGAISLLYNDSWVPIFEDTGCYGIYFDTKHDILFGITRINPQILAFKITKELEIEKIHINFKNYVFANDAHGIVIVDDSLYVVASNGEDGSKKATNDDGPGKYVGKIIVSTLNFKENSITVGNSKIYNPFNCSHHHHINDIVYFKNNFYISSFSYCNSDGNYIKKGTVSKIDLGKTGSVIIDELVHPHSLTHYNEQLFVCSSKLSQILSFNFKKKDLKLEYKGIDAFVRGLLITDTFFYFGISYGIGRTGSNFNNPINGIFRFDRTTGETKKFPIPENCNNIYSIIADPKS